ncbi:hypothetical protein PAHAL_9G381900 [Panicum hallii]|uniref:Uncharacterized protein n=1 Tax=Panicum hallii TaxID=206008 RepID=A0A2T8I3X2_9POAL|nr:hypothetical protein PAHAL_9G381900 [Panicum hallii]
MTQDRASCHLDETLLLERSFWQLKSAHVLETELLEPSPSARTIGVQFEGCTRRSRV